MAASPDALGRTVLVANQKGGVWKSSIVAALSAMIATPTRRVLVVDADQQGNVSKADLGNAGDRGRGLAMAFQYAQPLEPVRDVRPGLDLVPGGSMLAAINTLAPTAHSSGIDLAGNLRAALTTLCAEEKYALVLIDSGPGDVALLTALLHTARHLLVPTAADEASLDGVELLAKRYLRARTEGSLIGLLGVVLVAVNPRATARNAAVLTDVAAMLDGSGADPLSSTLRLDAAAAIDARSHHLTPNELVTANSEAKKSRLRALANGIRPRSADNLWSRDSSALANDYQQLAREVLTRIAAAEAEEVAS